MAKSAVLDNDTALSDFDEGPAEDEVIRDEAQDHKETQQPQEPTAPVDDGSDEYELDLGDETEQPGESNPPAEAAAPATEPADSGVDDGESFPPEMLQRAGISLERAKAVYGTPDELEKQFAAHLFNLGSEAERQQAASQTDAASDSSEKTPEEKLLEQQLKLELPPEFADVEDNKLLFEALAEQVGGFYAPQLKRLEEQLNELSTFRQQFVEQQQQEAARRQAEQVKREDDEFDRFCEELPEEWHELLGKEAPPPQNPDGTPNQQFEARKYLYGVAARFRAGLTQIDQEMSMAERARLGLRIAFPTQHDTIIKKSVTKQRQNGHVRMARPNNRRSAPPSGDQAAIDRLKARIEEGGSAKTDGVTVDDFV